MARQVLPELRSGDRLERAIRMRTYTVTKDRESGLWYAHQRGFPYVPVFGSFSERKSDAMEYVKMYNNLPNKVEQIERERKAEFQGYLTE